MTETKPSEAVRSPIQDLSKVPIKVHVYEMWLITLQLDAHVCIVQTHTQGSRVPVLVCVTGSSLWPISTAPTETPVLPSQSHTL